MAEILTLTSQPKPWQQFRGYAGYLLRPAHRRQWGGPLNAQAHRRAMFEELNAHFRFEVAVETGSFRGITTEYFASQVPKVYSVEIMPKYFGYARARLRACANVTLALGHSLELLKALAALGALGSRRAFCYLDAHWYEHLPLEEEIDAIYGQCPAAIVMIDDFQVPGDPDYGYADYGNGLAITPGYIATAVGRHGLRSFFPSIGGAQETGRRRGSIVLAKAGPGADALARMRTLRPA